MASQAFVDSVIKEIIQPVLINWRLCPVSPSCPPAVVGKTAARVGGRSSSAGKLERLE